MQTLAEVCGSAVAFTYRSIDRLLLNAYPRVLRDARFQGALYDVPS
jgi:hypothetical protein